MFEKEAEEYAIENYETCLYDDLPYANDSRAREQSFKDGAEFGYNKAKEEFACQLKEVVETCNHWQEVAEKANEWHYVKDELPRKSDSTLCELRPVFVAVKVGNRVSTYGTYWNLRLGNFECLDEVYAWCYTPEPPELPKESE